MPVKRNIPVGDTSRYLLGDGPFRFACHSGVACFARCCRNADMYLYPYDIIRLKQRLGLTSEEFLMQHTITALRENPYFPNVMLTMSDLPDNPCSFLSKWSTWPAIIWTPFAGSFLTAASYRVSTFRKSAWKPSAQATPPFCCWDLTGFCGFFSGKEHWKN